MSNSNSNPLFYVDNLQKDGSNYSVDFYFPDNFSYTTCEVIGNSPLIFEILKIEIYVTGDKNVEPSNDVATKTISLNLSDFQFSYLKFKIVWKLGTGIGGGVGDPDDDETVGEGVLKGVG
ncbi:hypothetical protein SAMN04487907_101278 [Zunongwangia mangrovi]|uniref:Uncharacterized protein n=1 Tax=Zunongwangia mangrovi TaxID=1334022 RepID=A0A1I1DCF4_9FLAO|nr:hypothetical protein [Zunongwangia mangrovi]SFB72625.1 hypothetical protein SAMN04487907_101278 [Zunongwangia mangrovi]